MTQLPPSPTPVSPIPSALPPEMPSPRQVTVSGLHWQNVFEFTHLFRGFRLAINPAKLMIALGAIFMIYIAGRAFDFAWGPQVYRGEIESFQSEKHEVYARHRQD